MLGVYMRVVYTSGMKNALDTHGISMMAGLAGRIRDALRAGLPSDQAGLALALGVTQSTVSRWLSGKQPMTLEVALFLVDRVCPDAPLELVSRVEDAAGAAQGSVRPIR